MHPPVVRSPTCGTSHELTSSTWKTSHPWTLVWHQAGRSFPLLFLFLKRLFLFLLRISDSIEILTSLPVVLRLSPFFPDYSLCPSLPGQIQADGLPGGGKHSPPIPKGSQARFSSSGSSKKQPWSQPRPAGQRRRKRS